MSTEEALIDQHQDAIQPFWAGLGVFHPPFGRVFSGVIVDGVLNDPQAMGGVMRYICQGYDPTDGSLLLIDVTNKTNTAYMWATYGNFMPPIGVVFTGTIVNGVLIGRCDTPGLLPCPMPIVGTDVGDVQELMTMLEQSNRPDHRVFALEVKSAIAQANDEQMHRDIMIYAEFRAPPHIHSILDQWDSSWRWDWTHERGHFHSQPTTKADSFVTD